MKYAFRLFSLLVLPAAFVLLTGTACDGGAAPDRAWDRGEFQPVPENQKAYSLPGGITIDSCYGYGDYIPESDVPLYMVVSNTNSGNTQVTFPAGLVFDPGDPDVQYMMLLQDFTFTANAGVTDSILVPTYFCNADLTEPDDESSYEIAGREWDKETEELLDIVASKQLNTDDAVTLAQTALTEITDDDGLTAATRTALQALP
ncbi:hypothetical protein FJY68_08400 [candidate division WOR-3 bacterium]|uniref:Uncharacterized protein n=1 Tax=candidate division WOR-3 bacterium TaxID=2052148 RepID=A0A937XIT4_UNCW3|nr:hypothetical protein [candidate division WOR-3 bacterium]